MSLQDRLNDDLKRALRSREELRKTTIRMLLSAIHNQQIQNRAPLDPQQELSVVDREAKVRREGVDEYTKLDRADLVEKNLAELAIIQEYLPTQLSEEELQGIVQDAIAGTNASSPADMGKVMGVVSPQVKGRADGKVVSQLVRRLLSERQGQG